METYNALLILREKRNTILWITEKSLKILQ